MGYLQILILRSISAGWRCCFIIVVGVLLGPLVWLAGCTAGKSSNPVVMENRHPGTTAWQVGLPGFLVANDQDRQVEGYASAASVSKGERIAFHVSVSPAQSFTADIYRMGWYGGLGGRLRTKVGPMSATRQPPCTPSKVTGLIDCSWPISFSLNVPEDWTSGIYLVLLSNAAKYQSYITFVVRDDSRAADFLYQQSVATYQAYNNYPNDGETGKSLYDFNSRGAAVAATNTARAAKVSFDRPYSDGNGSGQFGSWERYFVGWLERSGYDATYSTDLDTHVNGARLLDVKGFLSVGHDEYWSKAMMDAATQARDAGVNLGFFGSNTAYWQVRFEPSPAGAENRVMVCYKDARADPVKDAAATVTWRDTAVNRPEQSLVGIQYTAHLRDEGKGALYVVQDSSHWVWHGTGLANGDELPGILGYETDRFMPDYPTPANRSYTLLSRSPVVNTSGVNDYANSSIYQAPSGAWVFASGSNYWSFGLGKPGVTDTRVARATANVLDRFKAAPSARPLTPPRPFGLTAAALSSSVITLRWASDGGVNAQYTVERSEQGRPAWMVLTSTADTPSYRDSTVTPSRTYSYRVRTTTKGGQSVWSDGAAATTLSEPVFREGFPEPEGAAWSKARWTIITSQASVDVDQRSGRMALSNGPAAFAEATAQMPPIADSDVLASVRFPTTTPRGFLYLFSRASGDWVRGYPGASYFLRLLNDDGTIQLWKSHAGLTTLLASTPGGSAVGNQIQWVRFRVQGSRVSAKVWSESSPEPRSWEVAATDSTIRRPGVLQLKWAPSRPTAETLDVLLDDLESRRP